MEPIQTKWVIGTFKGDRATSVKEHAGAGLGYLIRREEGRGTNYTVEAAFKFPTDRPIPEHLEEVKDIFRVKKLDAMIDERSGLKRGRP